MAKALSQAEKVKLLELLPELEKLQAEKAKRDLLKADPLEFVQKAFEWGHGELVGYAGPDEWQVKVLGEMRDSVSPMTAFRKAVASGHGIGKAQPKDLMLYTPDGLRRFGDIQPGDMVFGADGFPVEVVAVHDRGILPVYRVAFDDGSSTVACADHVWTVKGRQQRRNGRDWVDMTTQELREAGMTRSNGKSRARQWEIPQQGEAQFPWVETPLHPYVLGLWLGDGGKRTSIITCGDDEPVQRLEDLGYRYGIGYKKGTSARAINLKGIRPALRELGLFYKYSYEKRVPRIYMENSPDVRAEVLRGLLDTDGTVGKESRTISFTSTSSGLAQDVVWLARSLGGKARFVERKATPFYTGRDGERVECRRAYNVHIQMPHGFMCFYIARKQARVATVEHRYLSRWIDSIEPEGEADCMCITVADPDGLYQTNDFIVTHNSALVSWIILWALATKPNTKGVVTANTETQLKTKTWAELAKWHRLFKLRDMFKFAATAIYHADGKFEKTWRVDQIPWSINNTEAFAGLHNQGNRILLIYDEASSIPDAIWEVSEGALTDKNTEIMWICFGNPTRNSGKFFECFHRLRHRWKVEQVDSRQAKLSNKEQIEEWREDYGEDSDFFKVRVRGEFPSAAFSQFIATDIVDACRRYKAQGYERMPKVLSVDVARFGDDETVIGLRQGRKFQVVGVHSGLDNIQVAQQVIYLAEEHQPKAIVVDGDGVGSGVVDYLRLQGWGRVLHEFHGGGRPDDTSTYANRRCEVWGLMRQMLKDGMEIPKDDKVLASQLTYVEFGFTKTNQLQLEKKEDMKGRGLGSPDRADSLAMSFAVRLPSDGAMRNMGMEEEDFLDRLSPLSSLNLSWMG